MPPLYWCLALAAFGPLFAAWPGLASPYALPKLAVLAFAAAAASFCAARPAAEKPSSGAKPDILRPLAALLGAAALACVFSYDRPESLLGEYSMRSHGLLTFVLCAAVAALAQSSGPAFPAFALAAGAGAGAALSAYGLVQLAGFDPVLNAIGTLAYGRVGSLAGSPVALGGILATLLPLQLRLALDGEGPRRRGAGWACLALTAAVLVLTWSRGAWLAAAAGAVCYLLWTGRAPRPGARLKLAAALVLAGAALAFAMGRVRPTAGSDRGRVAVWSSAWRMFAAHPLTGVGPDAFDLMLGRHKTEAYVRAYGGSGGQAHAHNDFLQALATTGLLGFAAYAWLLVAAWRRLRHALLDPDLRAGSAAAGAGLAALFVFAKFNPVPLDAFAAAALLLGLLDPRGARPRVLPAAAFAASAAGVLAAAWLLAADRRCLEGMRAQRDGLLERAVSRYAAAARLNPHEARYGFWLVGALRERARTEREPALRLALGADAVAAARALEREHPLDVRALHALGGSLAALALQGGPDGMTEAAAVLERGPASDWSYRPLLETRLTVANLRRDRRAADDSAARLARLDALER